MAISSRFPGWQQIAQVYAVAVLIVYGWTIMWFLWKFPSWEHFLSAGEILGVLAYALATDLLESLTVILAPILGSLVLPRKWFRESFVARGTALVMSGLAYMIYVAYQFKTKDDYPSFSLKPWSLALAIAAILLIVAVAGRIPFVRKAFEGLADRATVFLYLTIPLSLAALLLILVRWLQ